MEVQGYPNYLIYPDGRVWSKKRQGSKGGFIISHTDLNGYIFIRLSREGEVKSCKVHRLIAEHFIPNPENKPTVDHINRDPSDNRIENLRWATMKEQRANQGDYKLIYRNNTSGYKNISFHKVKNSWRFNSKRPKIDRHFKSKIKCICYKFIFNLKTACNIH